MIYIYECEFCGVGVEFNIDDLQEHNEFNYCKICFEKPYSKYDYEKAKEKGLDLDNFNDYETFYSLGIEK